MEEICKKTKPLRSLACAAKDNTLRLKSSSGGIFSLLANEIIKTGGTVYGTAMSNDCKSAEIIRIDNILDLKKIRGSKYVQARVGNIYATVKRDLDANLNVLFTGTPCQVNGLKLFLNREYDNLYCMDIICHGVPSPRLWRKHIEFIENKGRGKVCYVNFRCKDEGWKDFGLNAKMSDCKPYYNNKSDDIYMQYFLHNYCLRPSCYSCVAKKSNLSDLTVGDFWGADLYAPEMNDGKGVSIVFVRTHNGNLLLGKILENVTFKEIPYDVAVKDNKAEYTSVDRPKQRDDFFKDLVAMSYKKLYIKYLYNNPKRRLKKLLIDTGVWKVIKTAGGAKE